MSSGWFSRLRPCAGLAFAVAVLAHPSAAQAQTLTEALAATLATHPALRSDRAATQAAEQAVYTARSGFFPTVSLNSEANANTLYRRGGPTALYGRAGTVRADQMVFDGFRTARITDAAEADRAALAADYQANANSVLLGATRAYIHVLRDRELLDAARRFLTEHKKSIARVTEITRHDPGKRFDLVQLRMREAMAASFVTEREGALRASESQFRETIGQAPQALDVPARLQEAAFESLEAALTAADTQHPAVVAAAERLRKRRAERAQATALLVPRVDLTARYTKGWDRQAIAGENDETYAGVLASYALSTGGAQFAAVQSAERLEASAQERQAAVRRDVREAVRVAWAQREALAKTVPLASSYLKSALEVVEGYETQFLLGRRSVLELLLIRNEVYTSESRLLSLTYDQLLTDYLLAAQVGVLLKHFPGVAVAPARNAEKS